MRTRNVDVLYLDSSDLSISREFVSYYGVSVLNAVSFNMKVISEIKKAEVVIFSDSMLGTKLIKSRY